MVKRSAWRREVRGEEKGAREERVRAEEVARVAGKKMAQAKIARRPATAHLNTGDVVVGGPRFPTTP